MNHPHTRPRRNRKHSALRFWSAQAQVNRQDLVYPIFLVEGVKQQQALQALPGQFRWSIDQALLVCEKALQKGVPAVALFPAIEEKLKDPTGKIGLQEDALVVRGIQEIKKRFPELLLITDIALDPYSSDGHDGLVKSGRILNDETLPLFQKMAVLHAQAGADMVAPSDMMDGRVKAIREALDQSSHQEVLVLSYCAKFSSSFYGPFREALDSAPKQGDKKTYQMSPANSREALLELQLDTNEGADIVMVKPALAYLDIIHSFKQNSLLPVAAYNVSGEYAMVKAAAQKGWIDESQAIAEILMSIKRAGADIIFTYFALDDFQFKY